jgi:hypothetical protein
MTQGFLEEVRVIINQPVAQSDMVGHFVPGLTGDELRIWRFHSLGFLFQIKQKALKKMVLVHHCMRGHLQGPSVPSQEKTTFRNPI